MKKLNLIFAFFLFGVISLYAQSKETKPKFENMKGDVTKITIETDNDKVEFTGKEAEHLFKKMNSKHNIFIKKLADDNSERTENIMVWESEKGDSNITINVDDDFEGEDGDKVIRIEKNINGKKIIKEHKGSEAEKFIKKHHKGNLEFTSEDGDIQGIMGNDVDDIDWVSKSDSNTVMKKVNVEVEDGVKKVTVTTTENGKEIVEVYEGDKADEFLNKKQNDKVISHSKDGKGKVIKKEITIIEDDKN